MAKKRVTADELMRIIQERMAEFVEYGPRITNSVITMKGGWSARTNAKSEALYERLR